MATIKIAFTCYFILLGVTSCSRKDQHARRTEIVLLEGAGLDGICRLGESVSTAKRALGSVEKRKEFGESGSAEEREYTFKGSPITLDTIDRGDGEIIARISIEIQGSQSAMSVRRFRTGKSLELWPSLSTRQDVLRVYGNPTKTFLGFDNINVPLTIKNGYSYSLMQEQNPWVEYIHYPDIGIAFVLNSNSVVKCSVEEPKTMVIWRF